MTAEAQPHRGPFVNVDAKYRDGMAALAVVGAIGTHSKVVPSLSSVEAELAALEYAMALAAEHQDPMWPEWKRIAERLTFRTDCTSVAHASNRTPQMAELLRAHVHWRIVVVPRGENASAHSVAARAWREAGLL